MIPTLLISLGVLVIGFWMLSMYAWWKQEEGKLSPIDPADIHARIQQTMRLLRRTWYSSLLYLKRGVAWSSLKISKAFFVLFPKAEHAFAKRDELTGLKSGPSSYFLLTISESQKEENRTRRKRVV